MGRLGTRFPSAPSVAESKGLSQGRASTSREGSGHGVGGRQWLVGFCVSLSFQAVDAMVAVPSVACPQSPKQESGSGASPSWFTTQHHRPLGVWGGC